MLMNTVLCALALLLALQVWLRLVPTDPVRFHTAVTPTPKRMDGGMIEVIPGNGATLSKLAVIVEATARTRLFAGSVDQGRVTYITRSLFWGFPDFTTLDLQGDQIAIHARLRFGRKDFGVNSARVTDWLQRLYSVQKG